MQTLTPAQHKVLVAIADQTTPPFKGGPLFSVIRKLATMGLLVNASYEAGLTTEGLKAIGRTPQAIVPEGAQPVLTWAGEPAKDNPVIGYIVQGEDNLWTRYLVMPNGSLKKTGFSLDSANSQVALRKDYRREIGELPYRASILA